MCNIDTAKSYGESINLHAASPLWLLPASLKCRKFVNDTVSHLSANSSSSSLSCTSVQARKVHFAIDYWRRGVRENNRLFVRSLESESRGSLISPRSVKIVLRSLHWKNDFCIWNYDIFDTCDFGITTFFTCIKYKHFWKSDTQIYQIGATKWLSNITKHLVDPTLTQLFSGVRNFDFGDKILSSMHTVAKSRGIDPSQLFSSQS